MTTPILTWISESIALPRIAQDVFLATPRQNGEFWDISIARLLARHEGVHPVPVAAGAEWPTDYYWNRSNNGRDVCLVTGNGWWASMTDIPLPPKAVHKATMGFDFIHQVGDVFVPQRRP